MREEWFVDSSMYWTRNIDFDVRFRQQQNEWHRLFVGWHKIDFFDESSARHAEVFVFDAAVLTIMSRRVCYSC